MTNVTVDDLRTPHDPLVERWNLWGADEYSTWQDEQLSWKKTCCIGDWSFLWEWRFSGREALKLIADHSVNSFAAFDVGQAKHTIQCNDDGQVMHEGIVLRLGDDEFMSYGIGGFYLAYQLEHGDYEAQATMDDWFNFQVSGPNALFTLEAAAGESLRDIAFMRSRDVRIAGHEVKLLRQSMAGEIGFELQGPRAEAQDVRRAVIEAGQAFGIRQMGGRVAQINHLEACIPTITVDYLAAILNTDYGEHLFAVLPFIPGWFRVKGSFEGSRVEDWYRTPVELGWGQNIKFDHEFVGRAALEREVADPKRTIVTLVWNEDDVTDVYRSQLSKDGPRYEFMEMPRDMHGYLWADRVLSEDGADIGIATSRGFSEFFRAMLSLCTIDVSHATPGTDVYVVWGEPGTPQKKIRAVVAPAPYKRDNRRADLHALPSYR